MTNKKDEILNFSIITLGESGVGKTSIFRRFTYNIFDEGSVSTIGLSFSFKDVTLKNKKEIKLRLVDTAGEEKYRSLAKSYFKNADGVLFVFDLNNLETFNNIREWIRLFEENNQNNNNTVKYLIGNKDDLEIKVQKELIDELAYKYKFKYISSSAKNGNNIEKLFQQMSEDLYKNNQNSEYREQKKKSFSIKNPEKNDTDTKKSDCICNL